MFSLCSLAHSNAYLLQVFDLCHCYVEMQKQAAEACAAVAAQTAAVRGKLVYLRACV